jgi:exo-beta-1,3-glucanase (GH17 family)
MGRCPRSLGRCGAASFTLAATAVLLLAVLVGWGNPALAQSDGAPQGPLAEQGLGYGPYRDGQNPDFQHFPTVEEMRADLMQLRAVTSRLRTYGSAGPLRPLAGEATGLGFSVMAGAWLADPKEKHDQNEAEIAAVIEMANSGHATTVIVGNESLLRGDLSVDELRAYIARVRASVPAHVQVTTAEPWSGWIAHPELIQAVDVVLVHIYPFWEGRSIDQATAYFTAKYDEVKAAAGDKPVIVGETGWPSGGTSQQASVPAQVVPGEAEQRRYLEEITRAAEERGITVYWFAAYDEEWKWVEGVQSGGTGDGRLTLDRNFSGRYPGSPDSSPRRWTRSPGARG